jgi:serine/threonine protein kinase/tetratricopeptide (TPR) repeat protein
MEERELPSSGGRLAGDRTGAFRLERLLGRGGMGEVFLAVDERLDRRVAIKRIRDGSDPALRERFRREARSAARINHPAVVQIYDVIEDAGGDAIVMEYAEGRTLRGLLAEGLPDPVLAVRLAWEIAQGLDAAHAAGLIHRDLKAENVVVTPGGHAKILDFGLAKPLALERSEESLTEHGTILGTWHAMSPEQASGGDVDARTDLFSLGVLLYEMLTGRSPFRGSHSLDSLKRILTEQPPSLSTLRPDLPPDLAALAARLLEKDREARPRSAREVALRLGEIASSRELGFAVDSTASPGGSERGDPGDELTAVTVLERPATSSSPSWGDRSSALRPLRGRSWSWVAMAAGLALAAVGAFYLLGRFSLPPLRVAVLRPEVAPAGETNLALAGSGVLVATLSTLASLEGLAPVDPAQLTGAERSPADAARAVAAGEVLAATLEGQGDLGARVSLRRIDGREGRVLWAESFAVPADPRDLRLLAQAVTLHLRRAYPERRPREGTPELSVRGEDYADFLRIKERFDGGQVPLEPELARLERILRGSPRFLDAHLLVVAVTQNLFRSTREPRYLDRGLSAAARVRALAPADPRALTAQVRVAIAAARPEEARARLAELAASAPGDPDLFALSGQIAEGEGDLERAVADLGAAVERVPSWPNLFRLADLEVRTGRIAAARHHLEQLLERSPANLWGLDKLGNLELLSGDPARAERIYLDLARLKPQRSFYTNLGLARSLLGRTASAVEAYRKALELAPDHVVASLNLADAELALGNRQGAESRYRAILERLDASAAAATLSPVDRMIQAQCLAHLGRAREAVSVVQGPLRENSDDPEVLYLASLVYSLAGDRNSALVNAEEALKRGMEPRWFTLAAFGSFREDPELRAMLAQAGS